MDTTMTPMTSALAGRKAVVVAVAALGLGVGALIGSGLVALSRILFAAEPLLAAIPA